MNERSYLSIGDVLSLLREEFADITISKIRFLESRGLLIPERTPSGYRKFYDHDVDRLRWILRQQRENFLPLKVIKGRLEGQEPSSEPTPLFDVAGPSETPPLQPVFAGQASNRSHTHVEETPAHEPVVTRRTAQTATVAGMMSGRRLSAHSSAVTSGPAFDLLAPERRASKNGAEAIALVVAAAHDQTPSPRSTMSAPPVGGGSSAGAAASSPSGGGALADAPAGPARTAVPEPSKTVPKASSAVSSEAASAPSWGAPDGAAAATTPGAAVTASPDTASPETASPETASPETASPETASRATASPQTRSRATGEVPTRQISSSEVPNALDGASLTADELAQASGLDVAQIEELESYGLIESRMVAGVRCYDEGALVVSGLAAGFARFGVEARHLRMFKHAAERQAGMYSQIVMPLLRQRNPDARRRAHDDLTRLTELGASIQACFAKAVLRDLTGG